jgi:hypothetical protein
VGFLRTRKLSWSVIDHFELIGGTTRAFRRHGFPVMIAGISAGSRWSRRSEATGQVDALNKLLDQRRFPVQPSSEPAASRHLRGHRRGLWQRS